MTIVRARLTDANEGHQANSRVIGLDEDDGPGGDSREIALTFTDAANVNLLCCRVSKALEQRLGEVRPILHKGLLDRAADGRVPAVVGQSRQEGLVDSSWAGESADRLIRGMSEHTAGKVLGKRVMSQHIQGRIWLALDPEAIPQPHVRLHVEDFALAAVGNNVVVFWGSNWAHVLLELTCEKMIPGLESMVFRLGIRTDEEVLELVGTTRGPVGNLHHILLAMLAEPALVVVAKDFCGSWGLEELAPFVKNVLEVGIDLWVKECGIARRGSHSVVEDCTHWNANHADVGSCIRPMWRSGEGMVQDLEHFVVVSNLSLAGRILVIWLLVGNLVEHGVEPHVDSGVVLNEGLEIPQYWSQLLGVLCGIVDVMAEPLSVDSRVRR